MNTWIFLKHSRASHVEASKKSWMYVIFRNLGQHVNEMTAVAGFLIIRQNVNMATNAIMYCGMCI